jgi:hypothetical protein
VNDVVRIGRLAFRVRMLSTEKNSGEDIISDTENEIEMRRNSV